MKRTLLAAAAGVIGIFGATIATADNATMHGHNLRHEGTAIHLKDFDVTLDGRLLTATDGVYHPETGIVDLTGKVQLHFGTKARTFPGEIK